MPIEFTCSSCHKLLRVPDNSEGKPCQCPACGLIGNIPSKATESLEEVSLGIDSLDVDSSGVESHVVSKEVTSSNTANSPASATPQESSLTTVDCPKCQYPLRCRPELLGTKGQCKQCRHIFVIGDSSNPDIDQPALVFSCPKCDQLFDGKPEMEGRKGRCHACGEVFSIKLRKAQGESQPEVKSTLKSSAPASSGSSGGKSTGTASNESSISLQVKCGACDKMMAVPRTSAGKTVECPYCQQLLHIPSDQTKSSGARQSIFDQSPDELFGNGGTTLGPVGSASAYSSSPYPSNDTFNFGASPGSVGPSYGYGQPTASYVPVPHQPYAPTYEQPYNLPTEIYQAQAEARAVTNNPEILSIAFWHRQLSVSLSLSFGLALLMILISIPLVLVYDREPPPLPILVVISIPGFVSMFAGLWALVAYVILSIKVYDGGMAAVFLLGYFFGGCVPLLPLILQLVVLARARSILESSGFRCGFFGVVSSRL